MVPPPSLDLSSFPPLFILETRAWDERLKTSPTPHFGLLYAVFNSPPVVHPVFSGAPCADRPLNTRITVENFASSGCCHSWEGPVVTTFPPHEDESLPSGLRLKTSPNPDKHKTIDFVLNFKRLEN